MVPDGMIDTPEDWIVRRRKPRIVLIASIGVAGTLPRHTAHSRSMPRLREGPAW